MPVWMQRGAAPEFVGCVLDTREHNYYNDSDFVAVVWDPRQGRVRRIMYATTRAACDGWAEIDATPETLAQVHEWNRIEMTRQVKFVSARAAKQVRRDRLVIGTSNRSRKFPASTMGYAGDTYTNPWRQTVVDIDPIGGGARVYGVPVNTVAVADPSKYEMTDAEIDRFVTNSLSQRFPNEIASALTAPENLVHL